MREKSVFQFAKEQILKRDQLKLVFGGFGPPDNYLGGAVAECTAVCLDANGNEYTISCKGESCTSADYDGCSSENGSKSC